MMKMKLLFNFSILNVITFSNYQRLKNDLKLQKLKLLNGKLNLSFIDFYVKRVFQIFWK